LLAADLLVSVVDRSPFIYAVGRVIGLDTATTDDEAGGVVPAVGEAGPSKKRRKRRSRPGREAVPSKKKAKSGPTETGVR
jgi:hypothetical protein